MADHDPKTVGAAPADERAQQPQAQEAVPPSQSEQETPSPSQSQPPRPDTPPKSEAGPSSPPVPAKDDVSPQLQPGTAAEQVATSTTTTKGKAKDESLPSPPQPQQPEQTTPSTSSEPTLQPLPSQQQHASLPELDLAAAEDDYDDIISIPAPVDSTVPEAPPVCTITLLLPTGARHPYRIDEKYLVKRGVEIPDTTASGRYRDPFSISVYKLKELILREWRDEDWEGKPASPSSIRLIHFGKLLDDKEMLKKYQFTQDSPNVVHMSVRPAEMMEEEEGAKGAKTSTREGRRSREGGGGGCCVIL